MLHSYSEAGAKSMQKSDCRNGVVDVRVEHEHDGDDGACGHYIRPEPDNDIASHDFKRHESSFENEEVPASSESKRIVHESSSKSNEGRGYGEKSNHLCDTCGIALAVARHLSASGKEGCFGILDKVLGLCRYGKDFSLWKLGDGESH
jgi:hypothetical protein